MKLRLNQLNYIYVVIVNYLVACSPKIYTEITEGIFHEMNREYETSIYQYGESRMEDEWFLETSSNELDAQYFVLMNMNNEQRVMCYAITYFKLLSVRHSIEHWTLTQFEYSQKHLYVNFTFFIEFDLWSKSKVQTPEILQFTVPGIAFMLFSDSTRYT